MRDVTLVLPHFMNLGMLEEQQRIWADYPPELRSHLHVVVVDDCSPKGSRPEPEHFWIEGLGSIRCFRLRKKKRWNWLACRNLGAIKACTDWLLLTDIDHAVPVQTVERIINGDLREDHTYRFKRIVAPSPWPYDVTRCASWKSHNDSWLLTRNLMLSPLEWEDVAYRRGVGGYDERLSGCYGTSGEFKDRVCATARAIVELPEVLIRYPREVIPDASTPPALYNRKNDPANDADLAKRKRRRDQILQWQPLHQQTPWEAVALSPQMAVA